MTSDVVHGNFYHESSRVWLFFERINRSLMKDALHPTVEGYGVLARCIKRGISDMAGVAGGRGGGGGGGGGGAVGRGAEGGDIGEMV